MKTKEQLQAEVEAWKRYAEEMNKWHSYYFKFDKTKDQMSCGMDMPNKPGYQFANND